MRTTCALLAAVVAFDSGRLALHQVKYGGAAHPINLISLVLWCLFAVPAGAALGTGFARIGRPNFSGASPAERIACPRL